MAVKKEHKPLTKAQLMTHLAETTGLAKKDIVGVFDALTDIAYKEAKKEKGFTLPGFGKLIVVKRPRRKGRNPQSGEEIMIPARKALKFRIAKVAKDSVLGAPVKK